MPQPGAAHPATGPPVVHHGAGEIRGAARAAAFDTQPGGDEAAADAPPLDMGDIYRTLAGARSEIVAEFARRMTEARRTARPGEMAGIMRAIKSARSSALAALKQRAKGEVAGRRAAMIAARPRRKPRAVRPPPGHHA